MGTLMDPEVLQVAQDVAACRYSVCHGTEYSATRMLTTQGHSLEIPYLP
jgi:hypothetical protein